MKTKVIFRKFKTGEIIALFPELPGTNNPSTCLSYQHIGQHGAADLALVISDTLPASPAEYSGSKTELESIGYDLQIITRSSYRHFETRLRSISHERKNYN